MDGESSHGGKRKRESTVERELRRHCLGKAGSLGRGAAGEETQIVSLILALFHAPVLCDFLTL